MQIPKHVIDYIVERLRSNLRQTRVQYMSSFGGTSFCDAGHFSIKLLSVFAKHWDMQGCDGIHSEIEGKYYCRPVISIFHTHDGAYKNVVVKDTYNNIYTCLLILGNLTRWLIYSQSNTTIQQRWFKTKM